MLKWFIPAISLLMLLSCKSSVERNDAERRVIAKDQSKIFMQKPGDKSSCWIELLDRKDSIRGVYYSNEKLEDGTPIYYRSVMKNLVLINNHLRFETLDYLVSKKPFDSYDQEKVDLFIQDRTKWPVALKLPQTFSGTVTSDSLKLKILSPLSDSEFDELYLIRVE